MSCWRKKVPKVSRLDIFLLISGSPVIEMELSQGIQSDDMKSCLFLRKIKSVCWFSGISINGRACEEWSAMFLTYQGSICLKMSADYTAFNSGWINIYTRAPNESVLSRCLLNRDHLLLWCLCRYYIYILGVIYEMTLIPFINSKSLRQLIALTLT